MRRTSPFLAVCAAALGMIACSPADDAPANDARPSDDVQVQRDALGALLEEQWEYTMRTSPEWASMLGDKRYNDQISDFSEEAIETRLAESREFLERFEAIDTSGFTVQEALNRDLMVHRLQRGIEGARFKPWRMPVNQMSGVHLMAPQMVSMLSYTEVKDYDDLIARYRKLPTAFDQTIDHMRKGMDEGLIPPKFLLEKV
ncbi:MAG: DUF885 family protein, partial [Gemmatimonadota bacterium]